MSSLATSAGIYSSSDASLRLVSQTGRLKRRFDVSVSWGIFSFFSSSIGSLEIDASFEWASDTKGSAWETENKPALSCWESWAVSELIDLAKALWETECELRSWLLTLLDAEVLCVVALSADVERGVSGIVALLLCSSSRRERSRVASCKSRRIWSLKLRLSSADSECSLNLSVKAYLLYSNKRHYILKSQLMQINWSFVTVT